MFGRFRTAARRQPDRVVVAAAHLYPNARPASYGVTGWRGYGTGQQHPSAQIGAYAGTMLTQYPSMLPGVQLRCGVEGLRSGWYYPPINGQSVPLGSLQRTQRGAAAAPPNLTGPAGRYSGPVGPISSQIMASRVTAAQVRQSGVQAMQWARSLSGTAVNAATGNQGG